MAYVLPVKEFIKSIKNKDMQQSLGGLKLPDSAFFGDNKQNTNTRAKINISAKTSEANIKYLSKELKINLSGKNLDYTYSGYTVRFILSNKKSAGSRNSLGKKLADAGELATVMSLTKEIKTPMDTGEKLFIEDTDAFFKWMNTFKGTRLAVEKIVGNINSFVILHDATDKSKFKNVIDKFCKKIKIAKDSWNPADIFLIKKNKLTDIINTLDEIVNTYDLQTNLTQIFNIKIYDYYKEGLLYPISLKQLSSPKATVEYTNEPGKTKAAHYNISIERFNVDLSPQGKEIGLFVFNNVDTNKQISMQVRGFPHSYGTAQTEITSDGTPSGGRLGKISTKIVDRILEAYNFERIKSISFFGKAPNYFSTFDEKMKKSIYKKYETVIKYNKVNNKVMVSYDEFSQLIEKSKIDFELAKTMCMKIQGLVMMYFFVKNDKNIKPIMNNMINGAKKISDDNGFFIKIY